LSAAALIPSANLARAVRGEVLSFHRSPRADNDLDCLTHWPDGVVLIGIDGKVAQVAAWSPALSAQLSQKSVPTDDWTGHLVMPGFVDTHVHYAQMEVIASYGAQLLDWLERYTFPAERQFSNPEYASQVAQLFISELVANGTTTAAVWPTVHKASVDALFEQAQARNMRLACGKIMMDQHCPDYLQDSVASAENDCIDLIQRWHGQGRLTYAVTPRFAVTSSPQQLALAGELFKATPGALMQTHLAENADEIAWVAKLHPQARSYLDVYEKAGLLGPGAIFAHAIWLDDADWQSLQNSGSSIAFCPTSNLFLGSGLFDFAGARSKQIPVGLATDVGGGTSLSMLQTMQEAYKVQAMRGTRLSALSLYYAATLGGANALGMAQNIGQLAAGFEADMVVLKPAVTPTQLFRVGKADTLIEKLFAVAILGSRHNIASVYINGKTQPFGEV
jgi:guanine deaminase